MPGVTLSSGTTYGISLRDAGSHPGTAAAAPAVAASFMKERLDKPSGIAFLLMMTIDAIQRRLTLCMTLHAEAHIDFFYRHNSVHGLHSSVALLTLDFGMDVRSMGKLYKVRECVYAVPSNFEGLLFVIAPRPGDRSNSAGDSAAVTTNAPRDWRNPGVFGAARILVAILAGNFVDPGVNAMTERYRLNDVRPRRPRTF
jgi:hypothetical protein